MWTGRGCSWSDGVGWPIRNPDSNEARPGGRCACVDSAGSLLRCRPITDGRLLHHRCGGGACARVNVGLFWCRDRKQKLADLCEFFGFPYIYGN